jgi:hypothetical protein
MLMLRKPVATLAAAVLFLLSYTDAFAATFTVTGSLPRPLTNNQFEVQIKITGISAEQHQKGEAAGADANGSKIAKRFKFYLNDNSTALPFTADTASSVNFYAEESVVPLEEQSTSGSVTTWSHTYNVRFVGFNDSNALVTLAGSAKSVNVKFEFNLGDDIVLALANVSNTAIKQDSFVTNAAPSYLEGRMIEGTHKTIAVNFTVPTGDQPAISGSTTASKPVSRVLVYLVDTTVITGSVALNGKKYSGSDAEDTAVQCTLTLPAGNGPEACVECDGNVYLEKDLPAGITVRDVAPSDGTASFVGLENDRTYFAFMQYANGVQRSACLAGVPSRNYSLTELNGAKEATVVDFRCFIATAAYGSPTHARLKYFRKFRDEALLRIPGGRKLVNLYYKYSPPLAEYIAARPALRSAVRTLLEIPAGILETADTLY